MVLAHFLLVLSVMASSPATPRRHVVTSGEKFFFVMDPGNFADVPGKGVAYRAKRDGVEKLWEVTGWYAPPGSVLLSPDGNTLVRIRGHFFPMRGKEVRGEELVFIYHRGKLQHSYKAEELITNLEEGIQTNPFTLGFIWLDHTGERNPRIAPTEWHYVDTVTKGEVMISSRPDMMQLTTLEGTSLLFDLKSGWMFSRRVIKEEKPVELEDLDPFATDDDPFKTAQTEQEGTKQPATRLESKSEGGDKPKPVSKSVPR